MSHKRRASSINELSDLESIVAQEELVNIQLTLNGPILSKLQETEKIATRVDETLASLRSLQSLKRKLAKENPDADILVSRVLTCIAKSMTHPCSVHPILQAHHVTL